MVSGTDWLRRSLPSSQGEDGAHLLKAEGDFAAFLFAGVGDDGEVGGVDLEPREGSAENEAGHSSRLSDSSAKATKRAWRECESSAL